tara:strand:- start:15293 stop:15493 length:201 start_codon:yes stop_codon:yes gene_type:complete
MTRFSDEFVNNVKSYYDENKGNFKYTEKSGTHRKTTVHRKFGVKDVAEHFNLTISQVKRIIYVKKS